MRVQISSYKGTVFYSSLGNPVIALICFFWGGRGWLGGLGGGIVVGIFFFCGFEHIFL